MENISIDNYDTMNLVEKRLALLVGVKFIDRDKTLSAAADLRKLRKRLSIKAEGFSGTEAIRMRRDEDVLPPSPGQKFYET